MSIKSSRLRSFQISRGEIQAQNRQLENKLDQLEAKHQNETRRIQAAADAALAKLQIRLQQVEQAERLLQFQVKDLPDQLETIHRRIDHTTQNRESSRQTIERSLRTRGIAHLILLASALLTLFWLNSRQLNQLGEQKTSPVQPNGLTLLREKYQTLEENLSALAENIGDSQRTVSNRLVQLWIQNQNIASQLQNLQSQISGTAQNFRLLSTNLTSLQAEQLRLQKDLNWWVLSLGRLQLQLEKPPIPDPPDLERVTN